MRERPRLRLIWYLCLGRPFYLQHSKSAVCILYWCPAFMLPSFICGRDSIEHAGLPMPGDQHSSCPNMLSARQRWSYGVKLTLMTGMCLLQQKQQVCAWLTGQRHQEREYQI